MADFLRMPEALNYIAGQAWLSPEEPVQAVRQPNFEGSNTRLDRLGWREAVRQIRAIVRRI